MVVPEDTFSIFRGPSWVDPLARRLLPEEPRITLEKINSSGASDRLVRNDPPFEPESPPFASLHRLPAEIGASIPSSSFLSLPTIRGGWDFRPDHPFVMRADPSRAKRKKRFLACG